MLARGEGVEDGDGLGVTVFPVLGLSSVAGARLFSVFDLSSFESYIKHVLCQAGEVKNLLRRVNFI